MLFLGYLRTSLNAKSPKRTVHQSEHMLVQNQLALGVFETFFLKIKPQQFSAKIL